MNSKSMRSYSGSTPYSTRNTVQTRSENLSNLLSASTQSQHTWNKPLQSTYTGTHGLIDPIAEQLHRITKLTKSVRYRQHDNNVESNKENHNNDKTKSVVRQHKTSSAYDSAIPKFNELTFSPRHNKPQQIEQTSEQHIQLRPYSITNPFLYVGLNSHSSRLQSVAQLYSTQQGLLPQALPAQSSHAQLPPIPTRYRIQRSVNDVLNTYHHQYDSQINTFNEQTINQLYYEADKLLDSTQYRIHKQQSTANSINTKLLHCVDMLNSTVIPYENTDYDTQKPVFQRYPHVYNALTATNRAKAVAQKLLLQHSIVSLEDSIDTQQIPTQIAVQQELDTHKQHLRRLSQHSMVVAGANTIDLSSLSDEITDTQRRITRHGRLNIDITIPLNNSIDCNINMLPVSIVLAVCNLGCVPTSTVQYDVDLNDLVTDKCGITATYFTINVINSQTELLQARVVLQDHTLAALPAIQRAPVATVQCSTRSIQHSNKGELTKILTVPYQSVVDHAHAKQLFKAQKLTHHVVEMLERHGKSKDIRIVLHIKFEPA